MLKTIDGYQICDFSTTKRDKAERQRIVQEITMALTNNLACDVDYRIRKPLAHVNGLPDIDANGKGRIFLTALLGDLSKAMASEGLDALIKPHFAPGTIYTPAAGQADPGMLYCIDAIHGFSGDMSHGSSGVLFLRRREAYVSSTKK